MARFISILIFVAIVFVISSINEAFSENKAKKEKARYEASLSQELKDLRSKIFQNYYINDVNSIPSKPKVIIFKEGKYGTEIFEEVYKLLPEYIKSKDINVVNTAILYEHGEKVVGEYTNGGSAIKHYIDLKFVNLNTKSIFHNKRIEGGNPPQSIMVKPGSHQNGYGGRVSNIEVTDYIKEFLNGVEY